MTRKLWTLLASNDAGYPNAFTITCLEADGKVTLVQEFADGSQIVYVPTVEAR